MNNTYIATVGNSNLATGKNVLPVAKTTQTQVNTNVDTPPVNTGFDFFATDKTVFFAVVIMGVLLFVYVIKMALKPKKKQVVRRPINSKQLKTRNDSPNFQAKKEPKIKLNYATPSTLNACIRTFLERTRHK
jgi:hypothetical protein